MKAALVNAALVIASAAAGFVAVEAVYRTWLYGEAPQYFLQSIPNPETVSFFSRSLWAYDARYGYRYVRDTPVIAGTLSGGQTAGCRQLAPGDLGGLGRETSWRSGAELKIAVLGDSFTALADGGRTWPDDLEDELARRLGKRVDVINLALDGIGILQMLDVAAGEVPRLKPDLVVLAFITDDLTRARVWRTTASAGGYLRVFTTTQPEREPSLADAVDTAVIAPRATLDWCRRQPPPERTTDPLVREIEARYRLAAQLAENRLDVYDFGYSLVYDQLVHGTPFRQLDRPSKSSTNPRHALKDYARDPQLMQQLAALRASGTPLLVFHLASRSELRRNREYAFYDEAREPALVKSLAAVTHEPVLGTLGHLTTPVERLEDMGISASDDHPSKHGMAIYGRAVAEAVARRLRAPPSMAADVSGEAERRAVP